MKSPTMKRALSLLCLLLTLALPLAAQTNKKISELQQQRSELERQIAGSETLLRTTKKDVKSQLDNLALLTNQIAARKQLIAQIERDLKAIDSELDSVTRQLRTLRNDLKVKKERYEASVLYLQKNRSIQEKLMFILSAQSLSQTYRRYRYVREYATYQRIQGEELKKKQAQVEQKQQELQQVRSEKSRLLTFKNSEREKLEQQEKERRTMVANLQKKQKGLQNEIAQKRAQAEKLNKQIDRLIEQQIAESQKKAQAASGNTGSSSGSKGKPVEQYHLNESDRKLASSFEKNRGILPPPITGPYLIVSHYGTHEVSGLKNVKLDNKGIDLKGQKGAQARTIFDGEVSAIFQYNGLYNVLVRHGSYISVYCNLQRVTVKKGQKVKTKDTLGPIAPDASGNAVLHFQLRKETQKLNPELWLGK